MDIELTKPVVNRGRPVGAPAAKARPETEPVEVEQAAAAEEGASVEATAGPSVKPKPNQVAGFFDGFVKEGVDTVKGLYTLVTTNPITTAKGLVFMATHPRMAVQAITEPYTTAYKDGRYGELAGRATFQVMTMVLTSGALSKGGKGADVGGKVATPTATATQMGEKVATDMAKNIAKKQAVRTVEKQIADGTIAASQRGVAIANATREALPKVTERLAAHNVAQKVAQGIAKSGVADDALTKVMQAAGGKVSADNVYRFASAATKAGMKPDAIASQLAKFSTMSAKKAATEFPVALSLMKSQAPNAALIAAAGSTKSASAMANQMQRLEKLMASSSDDALKAGYKAQLDALKGALARPENARTADLVRRIAAGEKLGPAERALAGVGEKLDVIGRGVGNAGKEIADGGRAVRGFLDGPKTIGDYAKAVGSVPKAIGGAIDTSIDATLHLLKRGVDHLPRIPHITMADIAKIRVPSPWELITSPVTVPLGTAKWVLTHPGRAIGLAGTLGNLGNASQTGQALKAQLQDRSDADRGFREYALQEGDTLESIAEKELGSADRWQEIYMLNQALFDGLGENGAISAGTKIRLPIDAEPVDEPGEIEGPGEASPEAEAYKEAVLGLIDRKLASAQGEARNVLGALKARLGEMSAEEVYGLREQLEAQGLRVGATKPTSPTKPTPGKPAVDPAGPATEPSEPVDTTPRSYTVKKGDSLTQISENELGTWRRWKEIVSLNKEQYPSLEKNPNFINVGWKLDLPVAEAKAKVAAEAAAAPKAPVDAAPAAEASADVKPASAAKRTALTEQFGLQTGDGNWNNFWSEINSYPDGAVGPDTGSDEDRKALQTMLGKLGFPVKSTGSYYVMGADGNPRTNADGIPESPTAEAVIAFKRMAGITQSYNITGEDGQAAPDVNEYVDTRTREAMNITLRLLQGQGSITSDVLEAAVQEAGSLQGSSIGPEVGSPEAKRLVQQYLQGLGYPVEPSGEFDKATTDAIVDFKRRNGLAAGFKDAQGRAVFTPYVDGTTADALYQAAASQAAENN